MEIARERRKNLNVWGPFDNYRGQAKMFRVSLAQELLFSLVTILLVITVLVWGLKRARTGPALFFVGLFAFLDVLTIQPGIFGYLVQGRPSTDPLYALFDGLVVALLLFMYVYAIRELERHESFCQFVRHEALASARAELTNVPEPPPGLARVVILITARNEEESLGGVLSGLPTQRDGMEFKVLLVDDGSVDRTARLAQQRGAIVIRHGAPLGVGGPFKTGFLGAHNLNPDYLIHMDADGQHNPDDIMRILQPLRDGTADMVIGSRFRNVHPTHLSRIRTLGIHLYSKIVSALTGLSITDATSGYWGIRADRLPDIMFRAEKNYAVEMLLRAGRKGVRIQEVPVVQLPRRAGRSQFHGISLFFLYHPRALAQIVSAYTHPAPKFPTMSPRAIKRSSDSPSGRAPDGRTFPAGDGRVEVHLQPVEE